MSTPAAEANFRDGLVALSGGDPAGAAHHFQSAILIERQHSVARPQMRYLSYYGLALARSGRAHAPAIQACETATRRDPFNAELQLNLARVLALAGRTSRALAALERGLAISPSHPHIAAELARLERRSRPPLAFVPRSHPLNKFLGKMRAAIGSRPVGQKAITSPAR